MRDKRVNLVVPTALYIIESQSWPIQCQMVKTTPTVQTMSIRTQLDLPTILQVLHILINTLTLSCFAP